MDAGFGKQRIGADPKIYNGGGSKRDENQLSR